MHFVLYGEINLKVQYHINYYKEAISLKWLEQIVFSMLFIHRYNFQFITTFKHVYINQCIKDLYSLVFENTVSQFYRYMSTNKHKKVSMWYLEIILVMLATMNDVY